MALTHVREHFPRVSGTTVIRRLGRLCTSLVRLPPDDRGRLGCTVSTASVYTIREGLRDEPASGSASPWRTNSARSS